MLNLFSVSGNSPPVRDRPLIRGKPLARRIGARCRVCTGQPGPAYRPVTGQRTRAVYRGSPGHGSPGHNRGSPGQRFRYLVAARGSLNDAKTRFQTDSAYVRRTLQKIVLFPQNDFDPFSRISPIPVQKSGFGGNQGGSKSSINKDPKNRAKFLGTPDRAQQNFPGLSQRPLPRR